MIIQNTVLTEIPGLTSEQQLWINKNPQIVHGYIAKLSATRLEEEGAREKRKEELLVRVLDLRLRCIPRFSMSSFFALAGTVQSAKIGSLDGSFEEWFSKKTEINVLKSAGQVSRILAGSQSRSYATEPEIRSRIGEGSLEISTAHLCDFLIDVKDRKPWYMFYVRDVKNQLRVIHASWVSESWYIAAVEIGYPDELRNGGCVVSQKF